MTSSTTLAVAAAVPWRPVVSLTGAGSALLVVAALWPVGAVSGFALTVGTGALAAAAAYLLDEAAAEAVAATPTPLRTRGCARLAWAAGLFGAGVSGLAVVAQRSGSNTRLGLTAPLAGCILVAVAISATMRQRFAEPGELVGGALLALVVILALARPLQRWIDLFPTEAGQRWGVAFAVWGGAALVSVVTLARATRDAWD